MENNIKNELLITILGRNHKLALERNGRAYGARNLSKVAIENFDNLSSEVLREILLNIHNLMEDEVRASRRAYVECNTSTPSYIENPCPPLPTVKYKNAGY